LRRVCWEAAFDKYSFITNREEYALDIYQDRLDSTGADIEDSVYIVFNTPPFGFGNMAVLSYGNINPLTKFEGMQPVRDNENYYQHSLFGFEQWLDSSVRVRTKNNHMHCYLFPGSGFQLTDGGL
jgi:hypothetical protein